MAVQKEKEADGAATHVDEARQDASVLEAITLAEGLETEKQTPWTLPNAHCFGVLCVAYLCAFMNGYDGSLMGLVSLCLLILRGD